MAKRFVKIGKSLFLAVCLCASSAICSSNIAVAQVHTCDETPFYGFFGNCRLLLERTVDQIIISDAKVKRLKVQQKRNCSTKRQKIKNRVACKKISKKITQEQGFVLNFLLKTALPSQLSFCQCPEVTDRLNGIAVYPGAKIF